MSIITLTGSMTEQVLKKELVEFSTSIKSAKALCEAGTQDISSAYLLAWIPEQGEDCYTVLVNGSIVLRYCQPRHEQVARNIKVIPVAEYAKTIKSKTSKIKLALAIELAKNQPVETVYNEE